AASDGNEDIVHILLAGGADVNAVNHGGRTALHCASSVNNHRIAELLRQHGAIE
ncbi:MAG: ankyrin repeat domain-containing protein, partial [Candidatus Moranbacteria bacterium]|nr:ankyrin repeat domain-containing protein [Candidatus Moranbacteria bacterium]